MKKNFLINNFIIYFFFFFKKKKKIIVNISKKIIKKSTKRNAIKRIIKENLKNFFLNKTIIIKLFKINDIFDIKNKIIKHNIKKKIKILITFLKNKKIIY